MSLLRKVQQAALWKLSAPCKPLEYEHAGTPSAISSSPALPAELLKMQMPRW